MFEEIIDRNIYNIKTVVKQVYGEIVMWRAKVFSWHSRYKNGL